ncbi:MAG: HNH endonuclease, partial [Eggerthellaceae bacterium]|nr:HNH endonuclease [Eggerthellaceae bacterium]
GGIPDEDDSREQFDPIIDFPNFLLIVLKLTCIRKGMFDFASITLDDRENKEERMMIILDDKELKRQFDSVLNSLPGTKREKAEFVKEFAFNLLKCRFYLDNYIVHRDNGDGKPDNSPWELERWRRADDEKEPAAVSLFEDEEWRRKCRHLLSMFEVSYSPHQRKNYVLYCLLFLTEYGGVDGPSYYAFLSRRARRFLFGVYFWKSGGNENERVNEKNNAPLPGSFDLAVLGDGDAICREGGGWLASDPPQSTDALTVMEMRLGDGTKEVTRIPLFVFNYLDYLLWELYYDFARSKEGEDKKDNSAFFSQLGCGDFGLAPFKSFYFSATRSSLEHFFSQSEQRLDAQTRNQETEAPMDEAMINRFGNFAMISPDANSSASDLPPSAKRDRYAQYQKRDAVSINSLKFRIMLKICEEEKGWGKKQIVSHQSAMTDVLLGKAFDSLKKMCADTR